MSKPNPAAAAAEIHLRLNLDEVNLLLEAVGALPFARVYNLVARIQSQAAAQIPSAPAEAAKPAA